MPNFSKAETQAIIYLIDDKREETFANPQEKRKKKNLYIFKFY